MSGDNLATGTVRRRSIFDDHEEERDKLNNENESKLSFPDKVEICYPVEYVEKVRTEIEQWKMHITKTLQEKNKFKLERKELQNMTIDENILSLEQRNILASFNWEEYVRRAQNFCDRAAIIAHKMQYNPESEREKLYLYVQEKLEKQIRQEHSSD